MSRDRRTPGFWRRLISLRERPTSVATSSAAGGSGTFRIVGGLGIFGLLHILISGGSERRVLDGLILTFQVEFHAEALLKAIEEPLVDPTLRKASHEGTKLLSRVFALGYTHEIPNIVVEMEGSLLKEGLYSGSI